MSIYDINGQLLDSCCDVSGNNLESAYDLDADIVFPDSLTNELNVLSYNVGSFYTEATPTPNSLSDIFFNRNYGIFEDSNSYIAGLQESYRYIGNYDSTTLLNNFYRHIYSDYTVYASGDHSLSVCCKSKCYNVETVEFGTDGRYYQKAYFYYKGKRICFLNTHLSLNKEIRNREFLELLRAAENEQYFIITGDFNFSVKSVNDEEYNNSIKVALDMGYNSAQNAQSLIKTYYNGNTVETSSGTGAVVDNIITSSNIRIKNVRANTVKLTDGICPEYNIHIDHLPLVATVEVL